MRERENAECVHYGGRMNQIIRELKRQFTGETLEPEQFKGLIRTMSRRSQ